MVTLREYYEVCCDKENSVIAYSGLRLTDLTESNLLASEKITVLGVVKESRNKIKIFCSPRCLSVLGFKTRHYCFTFYERSLGFDPAYYYDKKRKRWYAHDYMPDFSEYISYINELVEEGRTIMVSDDTWILLKPRLRIKAIIDRTLPKYTWKELR